MSSRAVLWIACGMSAAFGQLAPVSAPVPEDPLEVVSGAILPADSAPTRAAALELLNRARENYALRAAKQAYDLRVSFTVNSGGQTLHDGAWTMEEIFDPRQGLRWTASADDYSVAEISTNQKSYSQASGYLPLRLHEARAALFGAIATAPNLSHAAIRTSSAIFNGKQLTCVLISNASSRDAEFATRQWDESEDCIDPQTGWLEIHSPVPGRYLAYDYTGAMAFAGHTLPKKVTVTEGGSTVSEISVDALTAPANLDRGLFTPAAEMKERAHASGITGALTISHVIGRVPSDSNVEGIAHPVCVFGVLTPAGKLVEAHSLQPSDPNSPVALADALRMSFSPAMLPPQQRFVFIVEKFVSAR